MPSWSVAFRPDWTIRSTARRPAQVRRAWRASWSRSPGRCSPPEHRANALRYTHGLPSDLRRKNAESIAHLHDGERQGLRKLIGQAGRDRRPLIAGLARQVGRELGEADGVLVFAPSAFPKKGTQSACPRAWT
ncbi:MAG: transposase [Gemmataceae bacterium]